MSLRDYLAMPQWRAAYQAGMDTSNFRNYGNWVYQDGGLSPIVIDSNNTYSVTMNRHCDTTCSYDTGITSPVLQGAANRVSLEACSDSTGAPFQCAQTLLKPRFTASQNYSTIHRY